MPTPDRLQTARDTYRAFAEGDRKLIEDVFEEDLAFSAPPDPLLDRDGYFERCWPHRGSTRHFDFVRLVEIGDEVLVTYEATKADGRRLRNTEILGFDGDRINRVEVYFGWDLE